jgi:hypothetical protein
MCPVAVLDCSYHTSDDVEIPLCRTVPGMTRPKAPRHAREAHTTGASVQARVPKGSVEPRQID